MDVRPLATPLALAALALPAAGQCPEQPPVPNHQGGGTVTCPCFVPGEEAGAVFTLPASEYPIEVTKVRIGWGSQLGGAPDSLEQGIHLYAGGLPNPGAPQFSVLGPVLTDGAINEFDLQGFPGNRVIASGSFTVTLQFFNQSAGQFFAPSVVHDGNGCTGGRNVVFAIPGGWIDACSAGVTGDWVFEVLYRKAPAALQQNGSGVNPLTLSSAAGPVLGAPWSASLDCSAHAPGLGVLFGYRLPGTPIPTAIGEVLVDLMSNQVLVNAQSHGGGVATFTNTPPNNLAFCGFEFYAQGLCLGSPGNQLSNRLYVRAGS